VPIRTRITAMSMVRRARPQSPMRRFRILTSIAIKARQASRRSCSSGDPGLTHRSTTCLV